MATFTVDSTLDTLDASAGDGFCDDGSGNCTLRAAIQEANALAGADTIHFNIGGGGQQTIQPLLANGSLPLITEELHIDGSTQPGAACGTASNLSDRTLLIQVDSVLITAGGSDTLATNTGADNSTFRGLVVNGGTEYGIQVFNSVNNVQITCSHFGVDFAGTAQATNPNFRGIGIGGGTNTTNTIIGGTSNGDRNIISGNSDDGVLVATSTTVTGTTFYGNHIGVDLEGDAVITNGGDGIQVGGPSTRVGGPNAGERNVISGNGTGGVRTINATVTNTIIQGNYIGTDVTGSLTGFGNTTAGVFDFGDATIIGGDSTAGEGNVISGNTTHGIQTGTAATTATIRGNYIGTNAAGTADVGNTLNGILVNLSDATIGGSGIGQRNVISGNDNHGIRFNNNGASGTVYGNYIGTAADGNSAIGNTFEGVSATTTGTVTVGGPNPGEGNVISGNRNGLGLDGTGPNQVQGNIIGLDFDGDAAVPNTDAGVFLNTNIGTMLIGGPNPGERNIISGNENHGINSSADNVTIQGNYVGTDINGTTEIGNGQDLGGFGPGVRVNGTGDTVLVGGDIAAERNIISGNKDEGVSIEGDNVTVQGNYIGLDVNGTTAMGNGRDGGGNGISFGNSAENPIVGGTNPGEGNVISGNATHGIDIFENSTNGQILGNYIGLAADGLTVIENGFQGILTGTGTTVGDGTVAGRNIFAGGTIGINLRFSGGSAKGNYVGTNVNGVTVTDSPVSTTGILVSSNANGATTIEIGGSGANEGNVIANAVDGIKIDDTTGVAATPTVRVQGNSVGVEADLTTAGTITGQGIDISTDATNVQVGGRNAGEGNLVANTAAGSVTIWTQSGSGNSILGNSIFGGTSTTVAPIDHNIDGPTVNDVGDGDVGTNGNEQMNFPIITNLTDLGGGNLQIQAFIDVPGGADYRFEVFNSATPHATGHGPGETFLTSLEGTIPAASGTLSVPIAVAAPLTAQISMTVTECVGGAVDGSCADATSFGNTSEFSNIKAVDGLLGIDFADAPDDTGGNSAGDYNTQAVNEGPYHIFDGSLFLGSCVDGDNGTYHENNVVTGSDDNFASVPVSGTCAVAGDDEDGVTVTADLTQGSGGAVKVVASAAGNLNAWVDFNQNGVFTDAGEQVVTDEAVTAGTNTIGFSVPGSATLGSTYARFRLASATGVASIGGALDGEVEDHAVTISAFTPPTEGPGGIITDLGLWLKADQDVFSDAGVTQATDTNDVQQWNDHSGYGIHVSQTDTGRQPNFATNSFNFNPAVTYIGGTDGDVLTNALTSVTGGDQSYTIFAVHDYNNTTGNGENLFAFGEPVLRENVAYHPNHFTAGTRVLYHFGDDLNFPPPLFGKQLNTFSYDSTLAGGTVDRFLYDTGSVTNSNEVSGALNLAASPRLSVGGYDHRGGVNGEELTGDISEFIVYDSTLSANDQKQVESYLAIKYGMTLDQTAPTPYLSSGAVEIYDADGAFDAYDSNIIGIGQDDTSTLDQRISQSVNTGSILTITTTLDFISANEDAGRTSLGDGNFLVVGHDGAGTGFSGTYNGVANTRMDQIWRADETGVVGVNYLAIPNTVSFPSGTKSLVVSSDTTFDINDTIVSLTDDGTHLYASHDFNDADYFTFIGFTDTDGDGVSDDDEQACFNGGDGNGDGTQDYIQSSVACVENTVLGGTTTIEITGGCNIIEALSVNPESSLAVQDETHDYPYGLTDFTLACGSVGQSGNVTVYYDREVDMSETTFKKFDPNTNAYSDITGSVTVSYGTTAINSTPVTTTMYVVTDGDSVTDHDGALDAGIHDPAGPAVPVDELSESGTAIRTPILIGMSVILAITVLHRVTTKRPKTP